MPLSISWRKNNDVLETSQPCFRILLCGHSQEMQHFGENKIKNVKSDHILGGHLDFLRYLCTFAIEDEAPKYQLHLQKDYCQTSKSFRI